MQSLHCQAQRAPSNPILQAQIYAAIGGTSNDEKSSFYLEQSFIFRGLDEMKLTRRSIQAARQYSTSIHEKIVYTAWLKYEKRDEEMNINPITTCNGNVLECPRAALILEPSPSMICDPCPCKTVFSWKENWSHWSDHFMEDNVVFRIGDRKVASNRKSLAARSMTHASNKGIT